MKEQQKTQEWVDPNQWVLAYGEIVSKSRAAWLIGKTPPYITYLLKRGELREYRSGISTRQLAEFQLTKRIEAVKKGVAQ